MTRPVAKRGRASRAATRPRAGHTTVRRRTTLRPDPRQAGDGLKLLLSLVVLVVGVAAAGTVVAWVARWWPLDAPLVIAAVALPAWGFWRSQTRAQAEAVQREEQQRERQRREQERQAALDRQVASTDGMTGTQFEYLVARLLRRDGWVGVRVQGGAGDLGADVVAHTATGARLVAQCKRYADAAVTSPDMQRFLGTVFTHHRAYQALFVTTSTFTRPAAQLARSHGVVLIDRPALAAWMAGAPLSALTRASGGSTS